MCQLTPISDLMTKVSNSLESRRMWRSIAEGGFVPLLELSRLMAMSHCDFDSLRLPLHAGVCVFVCVGEGAFTVVYVSTC